MSDTTNKRVWKPMDTYSEINVDDEYGTNYTVGVDGDDNLYVLNRSTGRAVVIQPDKYRLCRLVDAPPQAAMPEDEVAKLQARIAELEAQLRIAIQLAEIASDWNLDEVEIDGEMMRTMDLYHQFNAVFGGNE